MPTENAELIWIEHQPKSKKFDDIYLNTEEGLAEKKYVFIEGNNIASRLNEALTSAFVIAETGFGTGANLLATLEAISTIGSQPHPAVHFISYELYPLSLTDLTAVLKHHPELKHYSHQLLAQYPPAIEGMHRFIFDNGRFYLTLFIGDAQLGIAKTIASVDAWYLDGFSPAKNPEMWSEQLFRQIARLSKHGTSLATFTSARFVRNALTDNAFSIQKRSGFGKKREMITATFTPEATQKPNHIKAPWFSRPNHIAPQTAIVIGAGLAGCTTAEALARRGIQVTLVDANTEICQEASGNKQGALYAKLPITPTKSGEFHLCGLEYTLRLLKIHDALDNQIASQCGLLQLAINEREQTRQHATLDNGHYPEDVVSLVSQAEASQLSGTEVQYPALYFPRAGWVNPKRFCERLINNPLISLKLQTTATSITQSPDQKWRIITQHAEELTADMVVVCTAAQAKSFTLLDHLPVKPIRGQVSTVSSSDALSLKTVVCGEGYVSPPLEGSYSFGATFDLHDQTPEIREIDHTANLNMLRGALPELASTLDNKPWTAKVGYRCSTPDYLPITGVAPIPDMYRARYAKLADDKNWKFPNDEPPLHHGLFVNIGHGSKGLITAPLCAELLASLACNEPLPVPNDIFHALHPARFIIKDLIRNK